MDINQRLHDVEQSSTVYVHQAEKFHAEATHVNIDRSSLCKTKNLICLSVVNIAGKILSRS